VRILLQWIKEWLKANSVMLINASSLIGTTAVTSMLGFVYWWVAARRFPPEAVGIASASLSAMTLLGSFCMLGLGTLLITELPRQPDKAASLITTALLVVGGIGGCVGIVFAIIASYTLPGFKPLGTNVLNVLLFALGVSLSSITLVLDAAFIGLLRGGLQFWRNILLAIFKLVLLYIASLVVSGAGSMVIYATWAIGNTLSLVAIAAIIVLKQGWPGKRYLPQWRLLRKLGFAALQHHLLNVVLQSPVLILPVLVATLLSSTMNAWFYVAWMIASVVFLLPNVLTIVLHAMNSAQQSTLARKARVTMGLGLLACIVANGLLQFGASQVLGVFGKVYAEQAALTLRILLLASFPLIIKYHYISICRIHDRLAQAMWAMLPGGLIELGAAIVGAHVGGLLGLSLGWVVAIYIESLFMLPTVYKAVGSTDKTPLPLEQSFLAIESIWQMDTMALPVIRQEYSRTPPREAKLSNTLFHEEREVTQGSTASTHSTICPTNVPHKNHTRLKPLRLQRYKPELDEVDTRVTEKQIASPHGEKIYVHSTMKERHS
jgi:O-antigen/teichoic acid export membrane protein